MPVPPRVLDTRDVEEARSRLAAAYCEHRLSVRPRAGTFHAVQTEACVGAVRAHRLRYGVDLRIDAAPLTTSVLVTSPRRGVLSVGDGHHERRLGPGDVTTIDPDRPFTLRWDEDCELSTVQVPRRLLTGPVTARVVPSAQAHGWRRLFALLEAQAADAAAHPLLVGRLEELVAASVDVQHAEPGEAGSDVVRRVVGHVHAHAHEPLTTAALAEVAHLSVRGLQAALRRHLGTTPTGLVASVRLQRAHEELLRSDPASTTVEAVAHRWGFTNAGRFARAHRERYGRTPGEVLRD